MVAARRPPAPGLATDVCETIQLNFATTSTTPCQSLLSAYENTGLYSVLMGQPVDKAKGVGSGLNPHSRVQKLFRVCFRHNPLIKVLNLVFKMH